MRCSWRSALTDPRRVLVAWGFSEEGERVLLAVMLGMRESHHDWLALGSPFTSAV
jgi:hypothetical protein